MSILLSFIVHVLFTTALAWIWFKSDFPVYLTKWLRNRGIIRCPAEFWPDALTEATWLRHEWELWLTTKNPTLAHLLTCPVCLTTRISVVAALWVGLWTGYWVVLPFCIIAVPITCTWLNYGKK